ncbi:coiled-coil domain-containing protein 73-like [Dicentrarchus labrax]|uniref:Coiled-coil domain-containing protein 73 n=1 Tax=Dicentrarchus labrax TaxID=13489 RepID=A0A8C4NWF3_DICLA|nr:coiled-coil domain-containing protein 73-like [Dicentrarchus labrax]
MDLSADSGTLPTHHTVGEPAMEQELSLSSTRCQTESGGTILLQLLEFKTHLLEAVEELHIRRDAETRFEDQISKLVLEKQELEWEKGTLQHQTETVANQHTESLINVKKQFQAKIRNIEEEKGKYQVSAELKEKEIKNLKEELKSLQLLKYNLEKKSNELEQKLALQSRSKDSHLNQLGEVEKRFSALSRQCAMVKQAHEKLEQNVDEAMKINKKLISANEKQEETIVSLKKELEEVSIKLIKAKMSSVRHDKTHSPTGREQRIQQLHLKLNLETEMSKKLGEENVALRAEKLEVMRSLQHTQQLLLSQTQTVSRVELELQTQREQYQALKQEHEVMRKKSRAAEDKVALLMESYAAFKTNWDKEKAMLQDCIKSEQLDVQAVKEAYDELHQKHTELSSQAKVQDQHIYDLEIRDSSQSHSVSTQLFPALMEEIGAEETLNEPISSSESPSIGGLKYLAFTQTKNPDCLEETGAVTRLITTGETGGQDTPNHHQQSQFQQPLNPSKTFTYPLTNNNHFILRNVSDGSDSNILNKYINNSNTSESDPGVVSDLIQTASSVSDDDLLMSKGSCVSHTSTSTEKEQGWKDDVKRGKNNQEEEERNEEQQWNREEVEGEDVMEGGSAGEKRGTLMTQTTDRADRREDSQRSTEDVRDTKQPETETKDRAEGEGTVGMEERGKTGPETQIPTQTTTDTTTGKCDTQQVIDFMDTEPPLAACEPSDCSHKVSEKDADSSHVDEGSEIRREVHTFCSDEHQSVSHGPNSIIQEKQRLCHHEVQTCAQDTELPTHSLHQVFEKITEEKPADKSAASIPTEVSEPHSNICCSQTNIAAQSDNDVSIQELETPETQPSNPSGIISNMKQADETGDTYVSEELMRPTSQEISEQERGEPRTPTDNEDGDCSAYKKMERQSNVDTCENNAWQEPVENACADITIDNVKNDQINGAGDTETTKSKSDLTLSVHPSHENDASPEIASVKCSGQSPAKEMLLDYINESSLPSNKMYRSSFDWVSARRKTESSTTKSDVSGLHQFVQGPPLSDSGGLLTHPPSTVPMFLNSKHSKVPLVITKASDLLNASSVSGTAASLRRHQHGEWKAMGETATADKVSISSFPFSTLSLPVSSLPWQTTPGCSRAPTSATGLSSESDREPSCSQEREDQQSSFRAQISKIEQFLNTERLRLPKRRRTEN